MERSEALQHLHAPIEVRTEKRGLAVTTENYSLLFRADHPYAELSDAQNEKWASFFLAGSLDSREGNDETVSMRPPEWLLHKDKLTVRIPMDSSHWQQKTAVWTFQEDLIETHFEVQGSGHITDCRFFGGSYANGIDSGFFPSDMNATTLFTPEPDCDEGALRSAGEPASINVTGMSLPGRSDWLFTPAPYCFGFNRDANSTNKTEQWMMVGVAAPVPEQNFTDYRYDIRGGAFSLTLDYEGHMSVNTAFTSPSVLIHFAEDPYRGLQDYGNLAAREQLLTTTPLQVNEEWWKRPIFCGWGAQAELSRDTPLATAQQFARQDVYDSFLDTLADNGIVPGTITIDDKWQTAYATNEVDTEKWPALGDWIEDRHRVGQKVLLWLKAWDAEGLQPELCIRNSQGVPVGVDPSHPEYQAQVRDQVSLMLSENGYGADGFKIDFTARTPSGHSLETYGQEWGTALLHRLLKTIYTQAKLIKQDALVVTHTPNPWFRDVTDMIRLNDVICGPAVIPQMIHRAKVARAACPEHLIDTDNWPMPSKKDFRQYLTVQRSLGVPALYFTSQVAGEPLTESDYARIRSAWSAATSLPLI